MNGQKRQTRNDRFGNETMLIGCKPNKNGFPVGWVEIKGQLYKLEPAKSKKKVLKLGLKSLKCKNGIIGSGGF